MGLFALVGATPHQSGRSLPLSAKGDAERRSPTVFGVVSNDVRLDQVETKLPEVMRLTTTAIPK